MSNLRQAAEQALEALKQFRDISDFTPAMAVHSINALRQAIAEPGQEPVAWMGTDIESNPNKFRLNFFGGGIPLYTAPTPRKPLTDEEIALMYADLPTSEARMIDFARAIEAAHGIKEQP